MGTVTADGNLTLHTDGTLTNSRKIESGKTLKVEAGQGIQNNATGEMNGQDVVQQTTTLDNTGLINGTQRRHRNGKTYHQSRKWPYLWRGRDASGTGWKTAVKLNWKNSWPQR